MPFWSMAGTLMKTRPAIVAATILLAVTAGLLMKCGSGKTLPAPSDPPSFTLEARIKNIKVRPTGDHAQLILTAVFDQSGETSIRLEPPLVSLRTANQSPAARFIGPMLPEPLLTGPDPAEVTLHYWLPLSELKSPLFLEVSGRRHPVELPGL